MTQVSGRSEELALLAADHDDRSALAVLVSDLMTLTKIRITIMVVVTAYLGYAMSLPDGAGVNWRSLMAALAGTALSCMGASALNQVYERDTDARMHRTRHRPIPAGRISAIQGLALGLALALLGTAMLWALANPLAAMLNLLCVGSYALMYTPLKRVTSTSTIVGAVPGALPPVIGGAAAIGSVNGAVMVMFAIMFLWQLPHFLAIAWLYREDYARGGFPMLPVIDPDGRSTFRQTMLGCMALLPLGLLPTVMGVSGMVYFTGALICGAAFLGFGVALVIARTNAHARMLFFVSLIYLPVIFALMLIDKA